MENKEKERITYLKNEIYKLQSELELELILMEAKKKQNELIDLESKVIAILGFNKDSFKYVQIVSAQYRKFPFLHNIITVKYHGVKIGLAVCKSDYNTIIDYMPSIK